MIVIISDDFTGAAELAGIALKYNLSIEIQTKSDFASQADMIVVDLGTRSESKKNASRKARDIAGELKAAKPVLIYKKVDSLMRGHVLTELEALLDETGQDRVILVPANPSFGRTIKNGRYLIDGVELSKTDFANDPEYPATTANVLELLGDSEMWATSVASSADELPTDGIVIGECSSADDLDRWVSAIEPNTIPAGAADYFSKVLESQSIPLRHTKLTGDRASKTTGTLYIFGSSTTSSREFVAAFRDRDLPFCPLQGDITGADLANEDCVAVWAENVERALNDRDYALIAVDQPVFTDDRVSNRLAKMMAIVVKQMIDVHSISRLVIEGGTTASRIFAKLGYEKFEPLEQIAPGIILMREVKTSLEIITKVGSYPWVSRVLPAEIEVD